VALPYPKGRRLEEGKLTRSSRRLLGSSWLAANGLGQAMVAIERDWCFTECPLLFEALMKMPRDELTLQLHIIAHMFEGRFWVRLRIQVDL
jgi:hypothetical protein